MRIWHEEANYFYAMIGTITKRPSRRTSDPTVETVSDGFMAVCETPSYFAAVNETRDWGTLDGLRGKFCSPFYIGPSMGTHSRGAETPVGHSCSKGRCC
jgi:hypothetical protein